MRGRPTGRGGSRLAATLLLTISLAACGSSKQSTTPNTIHAGQVDLQLPQGWTVVNGHAVKPASGAAGADAAAPGATTATGDTIPLAKQDPTTKFFGALTTFQGCLRGLGVKFIGAPNPSDPKSPANDPTYVQNLTTCAAKSNILQALKDAAAAQNNLTPAQVQVQNKGYLAWRDCMIGRGWGIPTPKPNAKGLLFSFGGAGSSPPQFTPPPGQDILTSGDVQSCAAEAQKKVSQTSAGG